MSFDFRLITGPEDSKQLNFSSLCSRLVMKVFCDAKPVEGKGGDEGIDTFVGEFNGACQAFQHKYFLESLGPAQRRQIEESIRVAVSRHQLQAWTLMLPKDLTHSELRWFQQIQEKYAPLVIEWWGTTKLQQLLAENPDVAKDFRQELTISTWIINLNVNINVASVEDLAALLRGSTFGGLGLTPRPDIIMALAEDIKRRARLKVLIWGPGVSGGDIYDKRVQVRDQLTRLGHEAHFSEEVWTPNALSRSGLNLTVAEFIQAMVYDYIICFMSSPGSIGEVHDFAKNKKLAPKMMICIDRCHQSGYGAQGAIRIFEGFHGKVDWFEYPKDISDCHLSTRVLEHIVKVAESKQWEIANGSSR